MASKSLRRLNLSEAIVDRLATKNIKLCKDVLLQAPTDLLRLANCSSPQVQELISACSEAASPPCVRGIALRDTQEMPYGRFLSTSLSMLDRVLHGGFPAGNISEITGSAGSGKTQFCIMMSALAAISAEEKGEGAVIYFDTEGAFNAHRLLEIVKSRCPNITEKHVEDIIGRVNLIPVLSCTELINRMENLEEMIISKHVRLVVVDSVASVIRKEFGSAQQNFMERNDFIIRLAAILKYIAQFFKIPVITTNQITTKFNRGHHRTNISEEYSMCTDLDLHSQSHLTAALGNTWSHSVNTRLILQFLTCGARQILVAKSPVSPFAAVNYTIQACGLIQLGERVVAYEGTDPGEQSIRSRCVVPCVSTQWSSI